MSRYALLSRLMSPFGGNHVIVSSIVHRVSSPAKWCGSCSRVHSDRVPPNALHSHRVPPNPLLVPQHISPLRETGFECGRRGPFMVLISRFLCVSQAPCPITISAMSGAVRSTGLPQRSTGLPQQVDQQVFLNDQQVFLNRSSSTGRSTGLSQRPDAVQA